MRVGYEVRSPDLNPQEVDGGGVSLRPQKIVIITVTDAYIFIYTALLCNCRQSHARTACAVEPRKKKRRNVKTAAWVSPFKKRPTHLLVTTIRHLERLGVANRNQNFPGEWIATRPRQRTPRIHPPRATPFHLSC